MDDSRQSTPILLVLGSGDAGALGNRATFSNQLSPALRLSPSKRWECALVSATLPHPGGYASVFITCSLCADSRVGSRSIPLLFRVPAAADAGSYRAIQDSQIPVWVPVSGSTFGNVEVSCTANGLPIPAAADPLQDFTTVEIVIREAL